MIKNHLNLISTNVGKTMARLLLMSCVFAISAINAGAVQMIDTVGRPGGATFTPSTQFARDANGVIIDTMTIIGELCIYANDDPVSPLRLNRLTVSTEGSTIGVMPSIRIYRATTDDFRGAILLGWWTLEGTQYWWTPITGAGITAATSALQAGENKFYIVYIHSKPTADNAVQCGSPLVCSIRDYRVGNRNGSTTDATAYSYNIEESQVTVSRNMEFNPVEIINTDPQNFTVCADEESKSTTLSAVGGMGTILGTYYALQWYASRDNGQNWELIPGSPNSTRYTVVVDPTITHYSCRALHGANCNVIKDSVVFDMRYEFRNKSVNFIYEGNLQNDQFFISEDVPQGEILSFVSDLEAGQNTDPMYFWQVNRGKEWVDIGYAPTLNYIVPVGYSGRYQIRLVVRTNSATCVCTTEVVSDKIFEFNVAERKLDFEFINQPPTTKLLCKGGDEVFTTFVSYSGLIDESQSCWQKDGTDLLIDGKPVPGRYLEISRANESTVGWYYYKAVAKIFDADKYGRDTVYMEFYSDSCFVELMPRLELLYISPSQNYVIPGMPVSFEVSTSLIENTSNSNQGYQWYKHTVQGDIPLTDNHYRFGSKSNSLILITPQKKNGAVWEDVWTKNGEYYYVVVTGPCEILSTKDKPMNLLEGQGLSFSQNVMDYVICDVNEKAEFYVEVSVPAGVQNVRYQWYVDGSQATDVENVTGSKTPTLTLEPVTNSAVRVYCVVTAESDGSTLTINSDTAGVKYTTFANLTGNYSINSDSTALNLKLAWSTDNHDAKHSVNVYLDYVLWGTYTYEEITDNYNKTMEINIPLDYNFELLLAIDPDLLTIEVEMTNECGNVLSHASTLPVTNLVITPKQQESVTSINNAVITNFDILPNPANDIVTVEYSVKDAVRTTITLCDISGQNLINLFEGMSTVGANRLNFNLAILDIPAGTYFVRVNDGKNIISKQFVFVK